MSRALRRLEENYKAVRYDVYKFCQALNYQPTWQQRELLDVVQRAGGSRLQCAVKSGKGPGKSKVSGVVALWWCLQSYGTKIILTAPTLRQCKDVWLAEVERTLQDADPWLQSLFKITGTRVVVAGHKNWGVQIMTASSPEAALGFHEKNLKVICEEASGIDRKIMRSLKDTLSNPNAAMLMIGNPTNRDGDFFDAFNSERGNWKTLTFNAEETPASEWFDPIRNREIEEEFGRDSDVYRIAVLGEFPHADPNCVLSSDDLERCSDKKLLLPCARLSRAKQFGLDFARFGGDELTVYRRSGEAIVQWARMVRCDPSLLVNKAFLWQQECGWRDEDCWYVPDAGGMGQGVMQKFYDANKQVMEFHTGGRAVEHLKYANRMTEAWFNLRKKVTAGKAYLPADNLLLQQLCTRRYAVNKKGQMVLETKEDYKKRGHDSPDRADGLVQAFYDHTIAEPGAVSRPGRVSRVVGASYRN